MGIILRFQSIKLVVGSWRELDLEETLHVEDHCERIIKTFMTRSVMIYNVQKRERDL